MKFSDLPDLPLDTVNLAELRECVRAAVTQCELRPGPPPDTEALATFFGTIATRLNDLAASQG